MNNAGILELAQKEHVSLMRQLSEKEGEITMLRGESGIAKEAIDRYCPPEFYAAAMHWLKSKGL